MGNNGILTVRELVACLKVAKKTAYRFVAEGKIVGCKVVVLGDFKRAK